MSATPKWTPGPWTVGHGGDNQLRIYTRRGRVLCQFFCTGTNGEDEPIKDREANAPLMAAAPDMAEALEAIAARITGEYDNAALVKFGPLSINSDKDCLKLARDALATVRGKVSR